MKLSNDTINFFEIYFNELVDTISEHDKIRFKNCKYLTWKAKGRVDLIIDFTNYFSILYYDDFIKIKLGDRNFTLNRYFRQKVTNFADTEDYENQIRIGVLMIDKLKSLFNLKYP